MASTAANRPRLMNTPEWVFPWRGRKRTFFSMVVAHLIAAAGFALLLGTVRVRVVSPKPMAPRKASLIYLTDDAQGRALALQAQEGGPFPSRFEPAQWEGMAGLEAEALAASRETGKHYVPALRDLPAPTPIPPVALAARSGAVFPQRQPVVRAAPDLAKLKTVPVIYPLSGISPEAIPVELPSYTGTALRDKTPDFWQFPPWRFLICLDPSGHVVECVSSGRVGEKVVLEQGKSSEAGTQELETWLRGIQFRTTSEKPFRWFAVGIYFSNPPADEPDAR